MKGASAILPPHDALLNRATRNRTHGVEHVHFLVANLIGIERDHRLHRHETKELHQVILHHVAQRSRVVVIAATMFDPCLLYTSDAADEEDSVDLGGSR